MSNDHDGLPPLLSDERVLNLLPLRLRGESVRLTYDKGPYEVTHPTRDLIEIARAIESEVRASFAAELAALRVDADRLKIRGAAYEEAYRIAYQATFQSHTGHWDKTMQGGRGCPECIRAREARENCDKVLRDGLEKLAERAAIDQSLGKQDGSKG